MGRPPGTCKPVGDYGRRLHAAQLRAGLTTAQMARQLSMSRSTFSRLLHGAEGTQRLRNIIMRDAILAAAEGLPAADEPCPKRGRPKKALAPETPPAP